MTRIRQWVLALAFAVALALSFSSTVSADPGDTGHLTGSRSTERGGGSPTYLDPGDTGH